MRERLISSGTLEELAEAHDFNRIPDELLPANRYKVGTPKWLASADKSRFAILEGYLNRILTSQESQTLMPR